MSSKNSQHLVMNDLRNGSRRTRRLILAASALALGGLLAASPARAAVYHWDVVPGAAGPGNSQIDDGQGVWDTAAGNWTTDAGANNILWTDGGGSTNSAVFGAGVTGTGGTVSLGTTVYPTGITFNAAADGTSYNILNGTNPGIINWNNYGNSIGGANVCFNINVVGTNTTSTIAALLTNSQDAAGNYAGRFFYKTGTGKLIITGGLMCGDLNGGKNAQDAGLFVNGGIDASNESRMEVAAGTANTYSGNTFKYRTRVGDASGYNVLSITGTGQLRTGAIVIGENSTGYNQFNVSAPGISGNPTVITTGDNSALVIGGGGGAIGGSAASSNNSVSISNGAYFQSQGGSGTTNGGLGLTSGSNNNSMTVAGFNTANPTQYTTYTQSGQRFYVGGSGNNNQLQVNSGGKMTLRVMQIGDGGSGNSAIIDGTGISPSTLTVNEDLLIGDTTNSSNNSLTVRNGGFLSSNTRGGRIERSLSVGEGSNANGNSVTVTGSGTTWTDNGYQVLVSTNTINSQTPTSTSSNNSINIFDGATANINTGVSIAGTDTGTSHSSLNLGNHAGISTANIGSARDGAVNLYVANARLNFNDGRLTANTGGNLVYGLGSVTLTHTGYISTTQSNSAITSQIIDGTGSGNLTKEGSGTLILSNANNTYSGTTTISAGTLRLSAASNNISNSAIINVAGGAILDLSGLTSSTLQLASNQTLTGTGTVSGNVTAPNNSTLAPGGASIGALTLTGTVDLTGSGTASFRLGATGINDQAIVNGALTYGGYLKISSAPDTTVGNTWQIFNPVGGSSGTFTNNFVFGTDGSGSSGLLPTLTGKFWEFNYGTGTLSIIAGGPTTGNYFAPDIGGGGSGNWDSSTNVWATTPATQGAGAQATTGALNFTDAPGTATINGTATAVAGINFLNDGHIIAQGTSGPNLNLTGATQAANLLMVASASTATISVPLTGSNGMTKDGPGTLILGADNSGLTGGIMVNNGTLHTQHLNALGASATGSATVQPGATLLVDVPGVHLQSLTINGTVKTTTLLDLPDTYGNIELGTVDPVSHNTVVPGSLTLGATSGLLDLQDRTLLVHYTQSPTTPSLLDGPVNAIKAALVQGRNVAPGGVFDGPWTGTLGITSKRAADDFAAAHTATGSPNTEFYALGYGDTGKQTLGDGTITNKMLINDAGPNFFDPTANAGRGAGIGSTVFVRYTRVGDATMDGIVGNNDVTVLGLNFDPNYNPAGADGPKQWYDGDFNYNGIVDNNDVTILGLQFDPSNTSAVLFSSLVSQYGSSFAASFAQGYGMSHPTASVVPEPGVLTLLGVGALALIRRRRA